MVVRDEPTTVRGFPVKKQRGIVCISDDDDRRIIIQCWNTGNFNEPFTLPIYEAAFYNCGIPMKALIGYQVDCLISGHFPDAGPPELQVCLLILYYVHIRKYSSDSPRELFEVFQKCQWRPNTVLVLPRESFEGNQIRGIK